MKFFSKWNVPTGSLPLFREVGVPSTTDPNSQTNKPAATGASYQQNIVNVSDPGIALTIAAWYRGVELRAKTMGQMVVEYQRWDRQGECFVTDMYGDNARLNWLLQRRPNPMMTSSVLMELAEVHIITRGNAFIYIERDEDGTPRYFWLANEGGYNPAANTYTLTYNTPRGVVSKFEAPAEDVIHIPNTFRRYGGYMGIPTLLYAHDALTLAKTQEKESLENAAKGGKMKLLLQQDKGPNNFGVLAGGTVDKRQLKKYASEVNDDIYNHDVIALHGITGVTPISMSNSELQVLQSREFDVPQISRFLGVPKALLMDDSQSSYRTPEAATEEFMLRTIQPKMQEWEDELNSKLLTWRDYGRRRYIMKADLLTRLDKKGQAEINEIDLRTGVKTVNELRKEQNLPRVENGDINYISTNLAEVGSEKLRGEPSPQPTVEIEEGGIQ